MNKICLKTKFENGLFIELLDIFKTIPNGKDFQWAVLPIYEPTYIQEKAQDISSEVSKQIIAMKVASIDWKKLLVLSDGVGQFIDLVLIGCKDEKNLKPYPNDNEMFKTCDIVIVMFDTSYWEIGCKDQKLMDRFIQKFKHELK